MKRKIKLNFMKKNQVVVAVTGANANCSRIFELYK